VSYLPPGVQFGLIGKDGSQFIVQFAMDRQALHLLPTLDGTNITLEVGGYFFPRIQAITWLLFAIPVTGSSHLSKHPSANCRNQERQTLAHISLKTQTLFARATNDDKVRHPPTTALCRLLGSGLSPYGGCRNQGPAIGLNGKNTMKSSIKLRDLRIGPSRLALCLAIGLHTAVMNSGCLLVQAAMEPVDKKDVSWIHPGSKRTDIVSWLGEPDSVSYNNNETDVYKTSTNGFHSPTEKGFTIASIVICDAVTLGFLEVTVGWVALFADYKYEVYTITYTSNGRVESISCVKPPGDAECAA